MALSNQQFERTKHLALRLAGIELVERHRELLGRRARRLEIVDSSAMDSLLDAVEKGETTARHRFLGMLTTKFTGFFRHPRQFQIAAEHARRAAEGHMLSVPAPGSAGIPAGARPETPEDGGTKRCWNPYRAGKDASAPRRYCRDALATEQQGGACLWCAAAATGEEAYSLAMMLIEVFRCDNPPATILATDVDPESLATAERGEYKELALKGLEPARRERFLRPGGSRGHWAVIDAVRRLVQFRPLNLAMVPWTVEGPFDVILCRNVLMYLEASHRYAVLERMASLLAPNGLLMIDPTEHLGKARHLFTPEADAVYRRGRESFLSSQRA